MTKVFAYLKYGHRQSEIALSIFSELQANVVCFYSGASASDCARYQSPYMAVDNSPFDLDVVYKQTNTVVCHAGGGMVYSALYFGCPMILLPLQLEQYNTAYILDGMKISVTLRQDTTAIAAKKKIEGFFSDSRYGENAKIFSANIRSRPILGSVVAPANSPLFGQADNSVNSIVQAIETLRRNKPS